MNFCDIAGTLGFLAIVSEAVYKNKHPTAINNACGRKMSIFVLMLAWLISALWCLSFWLAELVYMEPLCLADAKSEQPSFFILWSAMLIAFINSLLVVIQAINLVIAKRRLRSIQRHLATIRNLEVKAYLQNGLFITDTDDKTLQNATDEEKQFKIIMLNSLLACLNENVDNLFFDNEPINKRNLSRNQRENIDMKDTFMQSNEITSLNELVVELEQYTTTRPHGLTIPDLENINERLKSNHAQFNNPDCVMQLTSFIQQIITGVKVYYSSFDKAIGHIKMVRAATILLTALVIITICNIPTAYGILSYLWNGHSISSFIHIRLLIPSKARFIFTSIYILIVGCMNNA